MMNGPSAGIVDFSDPRIGVRDRLQSWQGQLEVSGAERHSIDKPGKVVY